jgi:transcriptional regulator with XRE-family HTH domain
MPKSSAEKPPAHTTEDKIAFGAQLAQARKKAGLSLEAAATALRAEGHAISKAAVGHWETGQNLPDALWLRRLARLYKSSTDRLLFGGAVVETDELAPDIAEVAAAVAKLPDEQRAMFIAAMRNLLGMNDTAKPKGLSDVPTSDHINARQRGVKRMRAA